MRAMIGLLIAVLAVNAPVPTFANEREEQPAEKENTAAKPLTGVVVDEQGAPLAGADVLYSWWSKRTNQTITAKSDEQGQFTLQPPKDAAGGHWPQGEIWAGISGRRLTHQTLFQDGKPPAEDLRLALPPSENVAVTVVGPDAKPVVGAQLTLPVITYKENGSQIVPEPLHPYTQATTDEQGRAVLTAFDRDELSEIRVATANHGSQSRYLSPQMPNEAQPLKIALRAAGRVHGRLVAPEPELLDGISISLLSYPSGPDQNAELTIGSATAVSEKDGRFEVPALAAGMIKYIFVGQKPDRPFLPEIPGEIALGVGQDVEITIPFKPAVRVRGVVREAVTGMPLSGVMLGLNENNGTSSAPADTGDDGRFDFLRLPGPINFYLQFSTPRDVPAWFRYHWNHVPGGKTEFELPPIELAIARGRVVDGAGHAIVGAKIEKVVSKSEIEGQSVENPVVWYMEPRTLSTDAKGEYRAWVEVGAEYRVQIQVEGHAPQWTQWATFAADAPLVFPDVRIDALRSIAGRVVDRQGKPVVGATAIQSGDGPQRTQATSDKDGRFLLTGYQNEAAFVFAEKEGFRFHGQRVTAGDQAVKVVLARTSEPAERRLSTLPDVDPAADIDLAMRILKPALEKKPKGDNDRDGWQVLRELAKVDPAAALERLDALGVHGDQADALRLSIAQRWSAEHPDDATAIIESLNDAYSKAAAYTMAVDDMPDALKERKLEWLGKARLHLRGAGDPTMRTALSGFVARLMWESGDREQVPKIMAQIKPGVEELPLDGVAAYVRGVTAEALAPIDLPAALALINDVKDNGEYERHHGNVARILAAARADEALRVLKLMRDDFQRDYAALDVAYLMAPVNRERASEVAGMIGSLRVKALAHGWMALALSERDAQAALVELDRAYETLAKLAEGNDAHFNRYDNPPVFAAWLLPVVEKVAPDRVDEFLWHALSLRSASAKQDREELPRVSRAYLAMFLSRYDRDLARDLYGNVALESATKLDPQEFAFSSRGLYAAWAMIDPARAVEQYERLSEDLPNNTKNGVRGALTQVRELRRSRKDLGAV